MAIKHLYVTLDSQPISRDIARDVADSCHGAQESMSSISVLLATYLDAKWYHFKGVASRKHILDANYDLFHRLDLLNTKINHLYVERSHLDNPVARESDDYSAHVHTRDMAPPRWAEEVRKSASKTRQFAAWLWSRDETASAQQIEKVYTEMLDVYELHRLNLQAVVGTMRGLLAAFDSGDRTVWKLQTIDGSEMAWWQWLPDGLCEVKPLKRV